MNVLLLLILIFDVILKNRALAVLTLTCDGDFNFSDLNSEVNDTFLKGDLLFQVSEDIQYSIDCEDQQLLNVTGSSDGSDTTFVLSAKHLSEFCKSWISCVFTCTTSHKHLIIQAPVEVTQEYLLLFDEPYYTANVTWKSLTGTEVILNKDLGVTVVNCSGDLLFPSYTGRYSLHQSADDLPFIWEVETSGNSLFVNGILNNTTPAIYLTVVGVLENYFNQRIKGTATGTIIVSVIDDNDECTTNPCQNSGTCVYLLYGEYRCDCSESWSGDHCDEDVVVTDNGIIEPDDGSDMLTIVGGVVGAVFGIILIILTSVKLVRKYTKDRVQALKKIDD